MNFVCFKDENGEKLIIRVQDIKLITRNMGGKFTVITVFEGWKESFVITNSANEIMKIINKT